MKPGQPLMVRARGGRSWAPSLSVWGPVLAKAFAAIVAAVVLAVIGTRASARAWNGTPSRDNVPASRAAPSDPTGTTLVALGAQRATDATVQHVPVDAGTQGDADRAEKGSVRGGVLGDGRIVLNFATEEQLLRLPGIGPARARAIVALRERLGRFRSVDQLRRVKGIGRKTLQRILPNVVVDAPPTSNPEKDAG